MDRKENFHKNMQRLGNYFGITITKNIAQAYYEALLYIKPIPFEDICTKIISDRKPFKSQFPTITQFGPLYEAHRPQHESKEFEEQECSECSGEGLIYYKYWHFKYGRVYQSHIACGHCENWQRFYNTLHPHSVYSDNKFIYRHPGIERGDREQLKLRPGMIEISDNGMFQMKEKEMSDRILEIMGLNPELLEANK